MKIVQTKKIISKLSYIFKVAQIVDTTLICIKAVITFALPFK